MLFKNSELRSQYSECVFCGCTQDDCSHCIERTGEPCHWIYDGLCSACVKGIKALSIRQPWAWLIMNGYKSVENRTWKTNYRGPFLIHTGKTFDSDAFGFINTALWDMAGSSISLEGISTNKEDYTLGGFIGIGEISMCVEQSANPFFTGPYGFELSNVHPIEFIEYPGSLRFFNVPDSVIDNIELQTAGCDYEEAIE